MTGRFTSMDISTAEEWATIVDRDHRAPGAGWPNGSCACCESLADIVDGFAVDQLTHCLQTATRAEEAGADEELVVASLCHDIGKVISVPNHPRIAAEILKPYVRDEVYRGHRRPPGLPGSSLLRPPAHGPRRPGPTPR